MKTYFVNKNQTNNPGRHHEVHTPGCWWGDQIDEHDRDPLGTFENEAEALEAARIRYADADGCRDCCPLAHHG